jgi:hypothetical protein
MGTKRKTSGKLGELRRAETADATKALQERVDKLIGYAYSRLGGSPRIVPPTTVLNVTNYDKKILVLKVHSEWLPEITSRFCSEIEEQTKRATQFPGDYGYGFEYVTSIDYGFTLKDKRSGMTVILLRNLV